MKIFSLVLVMGLVISCSSRNDLFYDLSMSKKLTPDKILYHTNEAGMLGQLQFQDSLLIVIDDLGEKKFIIINLDTGKEILKYGEKGRGPGEFFSPAFVWNNNIVNKNSSYLSLYDDNSMRFLKINFEGIINDSGYKITSENFPAKLVGCTYFSLLQNKIVGKSCSSRDLGMFFIYDMNKKKEIWADYYPYYKANVRPGMCNYVYDVHPVACDKHNRVFCGMTFADLITIHDLEGNLVKSYKFSENDMPDIDPKTKMIRAGASVYFVDLHATDKYCYFMRMGYKSGEVEERKNGMHVLQFDWEGNIINSYKIDEYLYAFGVDEEKKMLLGVNSEDGEQFKILTYNLNYEN